MTAIRFQIFGIGSNFKHVQEKRLMLSDPCLSSETNYSLRLLISFIETCHQLLAFLKPGGEYATHTLYQYWIHRRVTKCCWVNSTVELSSICCLVAASSRLIYILPECFFQIPWLCNLNKDYKINRISVKCKVFWNFAI